jgi:hypothetical protein
LRTALRKPKTTLEATVLKKTLRLHQLSTSTVSVAGVIIVRWRTRTATNDATSPGAHDAAVRTAVRTPLLGTSTARNTGTATRASIIS